MGGKGERIEALFAGRLAAGRGEGKNMKAKNKISCPAARFSTLLREPQNSPRREGRSKKPTGKHNVSRKKGRRERTSALAGKERVVIQKFQKKTGRSLKSRCRGSKIVGARNGGREKGDRRQSWLVRVSRSVCWGRAVRLRTVIAGRRRSSACRQLKARGVAGFPRKEEDPRVV